MIAKEAKRSAEVDYIKSRLPYPCKVFFSSNRHAPDGDKKNFVRCEIIAVNEVSIEIANLDTGVVNTYDYDDIKKIVPSYADVTAKYIS